MSIWTNITLHGISYAPFRFTREGRLIAFSKAPDANEGGKEGGAEKNEENKEGQEKAKETVDGTTKETGDKAKELLGKAEGGAESAEGGDGEQTGPSAEELKQMQEQFEQQTAPAAPQGRGLFGPRKADPIFRPGETGTSAEFGTALTMPAANYMAWQSAVNAGGGVASLAAPATAGFATTATALAAPLAGWGAGYAIGKRYNRPLLGGAIGTGVGATAAAGINAGIATYAAAPVAATTASTLSAASTSAAVAAGSAGATVLGGLAGAAAAGAGVYGAGRLHERLWQKESGGILGTMAKGITSPLTLPMGALTWAHEKAWRSRVNEAAEPPAGFFKRVARGVAAPVTAPIGALAHAHEWAWGSEVQNPLARAGFGLIAPLSVAYRPLHKYVMKPGPVGLVKSIRNIWTGHPSDNDGLGKISGWVFSRPRSIFNWLARKPGEGAASEKAAPAAAPEPTAQPAPTPGKPEKADNPATQMAA